MRWEQGRAEIEHVIADKRLERVTPSREMADRLISQARTHLTSAAALAGNDPDGAYALMYDGARKALTAVLANQGLRPTTQGGHVAVYEAVMAQLDPPQGRVLRPFARMRRRRNGSEYPSREEPQITAAEVLEEHPRG